MAAAALGWVLCLGLVSSCAGRPALDPPGPSPAPTQTALAVLKPTPSPSPLPTLPVPSPTACAEANGRTESLAAIGPGMDTPIRARIHLPPCFDPSGKTRYPVLYLLHGQGFQSDQWERLGALSSADSLFKSGKLPFLIVLPNEEDTTANPYESPFGPALTGALVGQVDKSYPTCAERGCRAIGGLSRGASWAVYLGLKSWGLFGIIGAHSFPPFFNMDVQLPGMLASIPPDQYPRMYLDIGYSDPYRAPAAAFEELLNHSSIPHEWYLNVGGHDEAYWSAHTPEYLAWYARQFAP